MNGDSSEGIVIQELPSAYEKRHEHSVQYTYEVRRIHGLRMITYCSDSRFARLRTGMENPSMSPPKFIAADTKDKRVRRSDIEVWNSR